MRKSATVILFLIATMTCFGASPPSGHENSFMEQFEFEKPIKHSFEATAVQATNEVLVELGYPSHNFTVSQVNYESFEYVYTASESSIKPTELYFDKQNNKCTNIFEIQNINKRNRYWIRCSVSNA